MLQKTASTSIIPSMVSAPGTILSKSGRQNCRLDSRCFTDVYCTKALQARCLCHPVPVAPVDGIC
ncbi:unnamed protein product [Symbiodinium pilosum]|uniref:Uncharacterized protein n=1 Tax=Symbiodinium pilosum TaxID=2952 RepID=A0A812S6H7_SYMPI|nr:unnamed protein product [Symbiodinium pilosum]